MKPAARLLSLVAAMASLAIVVGWIATVRRPAADVFRPGTPGSPWNAWLVDAAVAGFVIVAAALAGFLLVRGRRIEAACRLGAGLAALAAGMAGLVLLQRLPLPRALAVDAGFGLSASMATCSALCAVGLHLFLRVWAVFPRPLAHEELEGYFVDNVVGSHQHWPVFARPWARWMVDPSWRVDLFEWLPRPAGAVVAGGLAAVVGLAWSWRAAPPPWGPYVAIPGAFALTGYAMVALAHLMIRLNWFHQHGTADERRLLQWPRLGALVGAASYLLPFLGIALPLMLSTWVLPSLFDSRWLIGIVDGAMFAVAFGILLIPLFFLTGLAVSILYEGAFDPRLALGRITAWTLVGVVLTLLFILVERAVVVWIAGAMNLDPRSGAVVAGAVIAATFQPLRRHLERLAQDLVARWMPLALLASGTASEGAVAIVDLSGSTRLAAESEPNALLASALLQKAARDAVADHDGVYVKSTGDGALLHFHEAADALAAVRAIHEVVAAGAGSLGLPALRLHSGVHWGSFTLLDDGDVHGQTVNVASRIADRAGPGEILLSSAVRDLLPAGTALRSLGAQQFRHVPEAMECFAVVDDTAPATAVAAVAEDAPAPREAATP